MRPPDARAGRWLLTHVSESRAPQIPGLPDLLPTLGLGGDFSEPGTWQAGGHRIEDTPLEPEAPSELKAKHEHMGREPATEATHLSRVPRASPGSSTTSRRPRAALPSPEGTTDLGKRESPLARSSQGEGRGSIWGLLHSVLKPP